MLESGCQTGFAPPKGRPLGQEGRVMIVAELIAMAALVISTLTIAAVVSIGAAHACG